MATDNQGSRAPAESCDWLDIPTTHCPRCGHSWANHGVTVGGCTQRDCACPLFRPAASPSPAGGATLLTLLAIVNTQEVRVSADPSETVESFVMRARCNAGYFGSDAEWELRDARGVRIDPAATIGDALRIFISPRPGEGA